ncbi:MAG TPA: glycosyltransferase family 39 protein [Thermoanaerobaculia bacterium]|nr:glycosyltransferase family 39 protein [Thermoanaerobaculia bacterium]
MDRVRTPFRILVAATLLSVAISPFSRDLFAGDETKYAQVIREMRESGSVFLPTLDGTPFTHKPPVHFWMIWALTFLFGVYSIWPFVIPSLVAFAFLLWIVIRLARELIPDADPWLAAFVCGTSLMVWVSAQTARMDVGFTALIAAGIWMLHRFFTRDDFRALLAGALAIALATLVKGPMAPVIFVALFAIEGWRRRRIPRGNYLPSLAALVFGPLLWFVPAIIAGGDAYAHEVLSKQMAGRAVGAWVHKSPPWFYLLRSPATLFPWFFLFAAALFALWRRGKADDGVKFAFSWIAAVVVPYSLLSSKLDVYMMALLPPVALVIAAYLARASGSRAGHRLNLAMLLLLAAIGIAAAAIGPEFVKGPERALAAAPAARGIFVALAAAALAGAIFSVRRGLLASTAALGLAPVVALAWAGSVAMPLINEAASTRPLVAAIARQNVPADQVVLHFCPHLWIRDMPRELEAIRHVGPEDLAAARPAVIITSRRHAGRIAGSLRGYRKVDSFAMIGKPFDVHRR